MKLVAQYEILISKPALDEILDFICRGVPFSSGTKFRLKLDWQFSKQKFRDLFDRISHKCLFANVFMKFLSFFMFKLIPFVP